MSYQKRHLYNEGEKTAHWSYFGPNGWLRTGWQQMGKVKNLYKVEQKTY